MTFFKTIILVTFFSYTVHSTEPQKPKTGVFSFNETTDTKTICEIIHTHYRDIVCNSIYDENAYTKESRNRYSTFLASLLNKDNCLVYKEDGKTVGYIQYSSKKSLLPGYGAFGEIKQLGVLKEHQGKNYGKYLLDAAEQTMKKNEPLRTIFVITTKEDVGRKFYQKNGFDHYTTIPSQMKNEHYVWCKLITKPYKKELLEKALSFIVKSLRR